MIGVGVLSCSCNRGERALPEWLVVRQEAVIEAAMALRSAVSSTAGLGQASVQERWRVR